MNISPIRFRFIPQNNFQRYATSPKLQYAYNLQKDTVTFGVGPKIADENQQRQTVPKELTKRVRNMAEQEGKDLAGTLRKELKPLIATTLEPDKPICIGDKGLKLRIKSENSINEKATLRKINNLEGLLQMGDIIGVRIVVKDESKQSVDAIMKTITKMVNRGELKIFEIENYCNSSNESYASKKSLNELKTACGVDLKRYAEASINSGYTALHLGVETKRGFYAEIQIMGAGLEDLKELEDFCYKIRCNKHLDEKYKSIEEEIKPAIKGLSEDNSKLYMQYIRDSYAFARNKTSPESGYRKKFDYIPIPYFLPKELDFAYLKQRKLECDAEASMN